MNADMKPVPATISAQIQGCQCAAGPCCRPKTIKNMPTPDKATPARSNRCAWVGSAGTSRAASASPTMPIGMLTKKIHCHPSPTSAPPANGPTTPATPAVAPHTLAATPRRCAGKIRVIVVKVCGVSTPAPMPCTTRAVISMAAPPDSPHHSDATVNTAKPITEPPGHQQHHGVPQQIRAGHPDDRVVADMQIGLDGRVGDGDDGRVHHDHEEADHHRPERIPRIPGVLTLREVGAIRPAGPGAPARPGRRPGHVSTSFQLAMTVTGRSAPG